MKKCLPDPLWKIFCQKLKNTDPGTHEIKCGLPGMQDKNFIIFCNECNDCFTISSGSHDQV
jgi:hypothetical protein